MSSVRRFSHIHGTAPLTATVDLVFNARITVFVGAQNTRTRILDLDQTWLGIQTVPKPVIANLLWSVTGPDIGFVHEAAVPEGLYAEPPYGVLEDLGR